MNLSLPVNKLSDLLWQKINQSLIKVGFFSNTRHCFVDSAERQNESMVEESIQSPKVKSGCGSLMEIDSYIRRCLTADDSQQQLIIDAVFALATDIRRK